jgi:hypothetical protein
MPGAWEIQPTVLCAILHTETTTLAWSVGLKNLQLNGRISLLSGMPYDHARNEACKQCLIEGWDYLFFLDSDVIPPADAIQRLIQKGKPIISGLYCRRSSPHAVPVAIKDGQWLTTLPKNKNNPLVEVHQVGAGCLLIRRNVLEQLPPQREGKHWFDWKVDMRGHNIFPDNQCLSEDFTFSQHAIKNGFKVILDTSVRCKHVGLAEAGYMSYVPLNPYSAA